MNEISFRRRRARTASQEALQRMSGCVVKGFSLIPTRLVTTPTNRRSAHHFLDGGLQMRKVIRSGIGLFALAGFSLSLQAAPGTHGQRGGHRGYRGGGHAGPRIGGHTRPGYGGTRWTRPGGHGHRGGQVGIPGIRGHGRGLPGSGRSWARNPRHGGHLRPFYGGYRPYYGGYGPYYGAYDPYYGAYSPYYSGGYRPGSDGYYSPYSSGGYYDPYYSQRRSSYGSPDWAAIDTDISPEEAEVYVDGEFMGTADDFDGFPEYLYLTPGSHELEFRRDGYEPRSIQISARAGERLDLDFRLPTLRGYR